VTEGFAGNIALKTAEGTANQISAYLREALRGSFASKVGYLFARQAFRALARKMDPRRVNGGILLGLEGVVIKSHGGSDAVGTARALEIGYEMVRDELLHKIQNSLSDRGDVMPERTGDTKDTVNL
jgi:phosphate acyltransferase